MCRKARVGLLVLLSAVIAPTSPAGAGAAPREVVTLADLGLGPIVMPAERRVALPGSHQRSAAWSVEYQLPSDAQQAAGQWWLVRLHARVTVARRGRVNAVLSASTDGRAAIQGEFRRGRSALTWNTLDLRRGFVSRVAHDRVIDFDDTNYAQDAGIHGASGVLRVQLEEFGPSRIRRVVILPDTGLLVTPDQPSELSLHPLRSRLSKDASQLRLPVLLEDRGDDARNVRVDAEVDRRHLRPIDATQTFKTIRSGSTVRTTLTFRVLRSGATTIHLAVTSNASEPTADVRVAPRAAASRRSRRGGATTTRIAIAAAFLVPAAGVLLWPRRR